MHLACLLSVRRVFHAISVIFSRLTRRAIFCSFLVCNGAGFDGESSIFYELNVKKPNDSSTFFVPSRSAMSVLRELCTSYRYWD